LLTLKFSQKKPSVSSLQDRALISWYSSQPYTP
jgi:hypothetical protein